MLISVAFSVVIVPLAGRLCDIHTGPGIPIAAFLFRCFVLFLFYNLSSPNDYISYAICTLVVVASIVEQISVDTMFAKNLAKGTRGLLNGVYSFMGLLGILVYSFVAGWCFDNLGPASPFVIIGILDLGFAITLIVLYKRGVFDK